MKKNNFKECPICAYNTLNSDELYSIYPIFSREDDPVQTDDSNFWGSANNFCLNDYKQ
jgi:hypothetical protein